MVVGDEVAMIQMPVAVWVVGAGLLGALGIQQLSISNLESDKVSLLSQSAMLELSNAQYLIDLESANLTIDEARQELERERSISAKREQSQKVVNKTLQQQLEALREEVQKNGKGSVCMRVRLPDYALGLFDDQDGDSNKAGGTKSNATKAVGN